MTKHETYAPVLGELKFRMSQSPCHGPVEICRSVYTPSQKNKKCDFSVKNVLGPIRSWVCLPNICCTTSFIDDLSISTPIIYQKSWWFRGKYVKNGDAFHFNPHDEDFSMSKFSSSFGDLILLFLPRSPPVQTWMSISWRTKPEAQESNVITWNRDNLNGRANLALPIPLVFFLLSNRSPFMADLSWEDWMIHVQSMDSSPGPGGFWTIAKPAATDVKMMSNGSLESLEFAGFLIHHGWTWKKTHVVGIHHGLWQWLPWLTLKVIGWFRTPRHRNLSTPKNPPSHMERRTSPKYSWWTTQQGHYQVLEWS